jgi:hypothetical protein
MSDRLVRFGDRKKGSTAAIRGASTPSFGRTLEAGPQARALPVQVGGAIQHPYCTGEPAWQESFRACLRRWSENRRRLRWFAYGCPQIGECEVKLTPISIGALYAFPS